MCPMRALQSALVLVTIVTPAFAEPPEPRVRLFTTGLVDADAAPRDGQMMLGLFAAKDGFELRATRVAVAEPDWAGAEDEIAYREIRAEEGEALILINDAGGLLREGRVPTALAGVTFVAMGSQVSIPLEGDVYQVAGTRFEVVRPPAAPEDEEEREPLCGWMLSRGDTGQHVETVRCFGDFSISSPLASLGAPAILWAGDMDGDGRLDLLVASALADDEYGADELKLYLSSLAGSRSLVGLAGKCAIDMSFGC